MKRATLAGELRRVRIAWPLFADDLANIGIKTMESVTITIETGSAAFEDSPASEVARILRDLASRFERDGASPCLTLRDMNGNRCGLVSIQAVQS